jgi:outer membrane protein assembly factor BamB
MIFGAYDRNVHFVDADTGEATRSPFRTDGHVKGTPTIDPDGYPLLYFGSRDHRLRIVALDRGDPIELWQTNVTDVEGRWWHDWDASPRIVDDIMFEGAENSLFYIWKLNRGYDNEGNVTVAPRLLFKMETWNQELLNAISPSGYMATSVENSAAYFEGTVYFANSAGRVIGLDVTNVESGEAPIVFDYWVGDDVDASIVVDEEGMLYVSSEYERYNSRAQELGQLVKLDPSRPNDPYLWGMFSLTESPFKGGMWVTPALGDGVLYTITNKGFLVVVDRETGEEVWLEDVGSGSYTEPRHMSSPLVVDDHLVLATVDGKLRSYDITDPRNPVLEWQHEVSATKIEATPAMWDGVVYIASWDGFMYAVGE